MSESRAEGTMMSLPLTLDVLVERAATQCGDIEVVSRGPGSASDRTTYGKVATRARRPHVKVRAASMPQAAWRAAPPE